MDQAITPAAKSILLEFTSRMTFAARQRLALTDALDGFRLLPLAWKLGWLDIRLRYRGSLLGPFWLTLSTAVMVFALGVLYAGLFKMDIHEYLPSLALSLVLWGFFASMVAEGSTTFNEAEAIIRSMRMPLMVFALRTVIRNILVLAHNVIVIVAVFAIFSVWPGWHVLLMLPGLVLWIIDAIAVVLLLGPLCARFRDIPPIVNSVMQILFFITPILWKPEQLGASAWTLPFNPFYDLIEVVRSPLLGSAPPSEAWLAGLGYSIVLCLLAWIFFVRARGRVAFWL